MTSESSESQLDSVPIISNCEKIETQVTFFPPLHDSRRAWVLDVLRKEQVTSVLDIGCGQGSLLSCLCNSPVFLPLAEGTRIPNTTCDLKEWNLSWETDIHLYRVAGLDISERSLEECALATAPIAETDHYCLPRWEPLTVDLWHGSLVSENSAFMEYECIVSTEVIEHLPASVLPSFAPVLLGAYSPRLLLVTTPNYTFNARFSAPGIIDTEGYPDPTHRTSRIFRHSDHKFEWTVAEFTDWCETAARNWVYDVVVDGIGKPNEKDPWGRDVELGHASHSALFRRIDTTEANEEREKALDEYRNSRFDDQREQAHMLWKSHFHPAHPKAANPAPLEEVQKAVWEFMSSYYTESGYTIWDLWVCNEVSSACGGHLEILLSALATSNGFSIAKSKRSPNSEVSERGTLQGEEKELQVTEWIVKFAGEKHLEALDRTGKIDNGRTWADRVPEGTRSEDEQSLEGQNARDEMGTNLKGIDNGAGDTLSFESPTLESMAGWVDAVPDNLVNIDKVEGWYGWGSTTEWQDNDWST